MKGLVGRHMDYKHKQWAVFDLHEYSANYEFAASLFKLTAQIPD